MEGKHDAGGVNVVIRRPTSVMVLGGVDAEVILGFAPLNILFIADLRTGSPEVRILEIGLEPQYEATNKGNTA